MYFSRNDTVGAGFPLDTNAYSILRRYSDGQVAGTVSRFGKGWVGLSGSVPLLLHPWSIDNSVR